MEKGQSKNLIVVVGNGFDIAHGLKTSYGHFADYYLEEVLIEKILNIHNNKEYFIREFYREINELLKSSSYTFNLEINNSNFIRNIANCIYKPQELDNIKIIDYIKLNSSILSGVISNTLLSKLYTDTDKNNWFNVEKTYFELISKAPKTNSNLPQKYNSELKHIEEELVTYLKNKIKSERNNSIDSFLNRYLTKYENVYFVNFNYTDTLKFYTDTISNSSDYYGKNIKVNHIHGSIAEGDIIFGYGNDQNEEYQELKKTENDAFLENFKTFKYLQNDNYKKLYTEALDVFERYDALVLGHSLGTTDKTLLEEIFNHKECNEIMLCKRQKIAGTDVENDDDVKREFNKLLYAMSRVIENDVRLRDKIVDFKNADTF